MTDPVLHVIAGPNGAGKTTFYRRVLEPATHLSFVNADLIAAHWWPGKEHEHAYEAAAAAASQRQDSIELRRSFVTETVFSHESKVHLIREAEDAGHRVTLHVVLIPEDLAVARVLARVANGGHDVPEVKVRERFGRLWDHLADAIGLVGEAHVYVNTSAKAPFQLMATYLDGHVISEPQWPSWTPEPLRGAGT